MELNDWRVYLRMIGLVAIQPDLGNAAIIVLTTVVMFSISGVGYIGSRPYLQAL